MSEHKLTRWFSGSDKPVRVGVYQRDHLSWGKCYQYFNGEKWCYPSRTVDGAWVMRFDLSDDQTSPWRGLAEEPK